MDATAFFISKAWPRDFGCGDFLMHFAAVRMLPEDGEAVATGGFF
ncbi:hypothetical protein [Bhargavaea cecembensis]|nr:hypothetical protein [Bhargavaea cecembensis]